MTASGTAHAQRAFFGKYVVAAAFVLAIFGWGAGFYGPPVFLAAVVERTGWSVEFVSAAVTVHFLCGALVIARLPALHRRYGVAAVTSVGVLVLTAGLVGWAIAPAQWSLLLAALFTGAGWVTMGAAALNAVVSPWFVRTRPRALSIAYNGASFGGVVMAPLWAGLIARFSFLTAVIAVAVVMVPTVLMMSRLVFARTPKQLGQHPDGEPPAPVTERVTPARTTCTGASPLRSRAFVTLAVAMALGLFAQIGLLTHLFSVLVPQMGDQAAGWVMAAVTAASIAGRFLADRITTADTNRRVVACLSYGAQLVGSLVLLASGGGSVPLLLVGSVLFGVGVGNATSLPPLIAQREFPDGDVPRVVALAIAVAQGTYAFAPLVFGLLISNPSPATGATALFLAAAAVQVLAISSLLIGRRQRMEMA